MRKILIVAALLAAAPFSASADALSYTYVEGGWTQVQVDDNVLDDPKVDGGYLRGSVALAEQVYVFGGWSRTSKTRHYGEDSLKLELNQPELGIGYHMPWTDRLDFTADAAWVRQNAESTLRYDGVRYHGKDHTNLGRVTLGIRGKPSRMTEAWAKAGYMDGGNNYKGTGRHRRRPDQLHQDLGSGGRDRRLSRRHPVLGWRARQLLIQRSLLVVRSNGPREARFWPARTGPWRPGVITPTNRCARLARIWNRKHCHEDPLRTLLASALLSAPLLAGAAPATLTPEQAFDLYARVLLEDDAAATRTLNDALKPAFEGQDAVTPNPGALAKALAEPWQVVLASAGAKADAAATEALYAKALRDSKCRATKSVIEDNEYVEGQKLARIAFSCQVPDLGNVRPLFAASLAADASPAARKQFTDAYTQALQSARACRSAAPSPCTRPRTTATGTAAISMTW